jgi:hypothetical protein
MLLSCSVDPIEEAWARVEADWGSEDAHRRFVGVCVALQIDTLIALATQQLQDTRVRPPTTQHKRTLTWAAFFIMLVLMGAGILFLMRG